MEIGGYTMKTNSSSHNLILILGMVGILVLAGIFDYTLDALAVQNSETGTLDLLLVWLFPLLEFLWALAAVGLVWYIIAGRSYSRWVCAVYLIFGLVLLYASPILYVTNLPDSLYVILIYLTPGSMLYQASGITAAIGLLSLWFWQAPASIPVEEKSEGNQIENPVD